MRAAVSSNPSRQMPLQGIPAGVGSLGPPPERRGQGGARERISVDLRGLAPRLNAYAAAHGRTPTAVIRIALAQMLDSEALDEGYEANGEPMLVATSTKVTLRISAVHAACLARRARLSEMSQGSYVSALLDGERPAPLPANHDAAIQALMGSTDHLAVLSADLNGFVRLVGKVSNPELQRYRASVVSVVEDVRKHLAQASALIAEIRAVRRGRR